MKKYEIAEQLGISRPTLDKYLKEGLPKQYSKENTIIYDTKYELTQHLLDLNYRKDKLLLEIKMLDKMIEETQKKLVEKVSDDNE